MGKTSPARDFEIQRYAEETAECVRPLIPDESKMRERIADFRIHLNLAMESWSFGPVKISPWSFFAGVSHRSPPIEPWNPNWQRAFLCSFFPRRLVLSLPVTSNCLATDLISRDGRQENEDVTTPMMIIVNKIMYLLFNIIFSFQREWFYIFLYFFKHVGHSKYHKQNCSSLYILTIVSHFSISFLVVTVLVLLLISFAQRQLIELTRNLFVDLIYGEHLFPENVQLYNRDQTRFWNWVIWVPLLAIDTGLLYYRDNLPWWSKKHMLFKYFRPLVLFSSCCHSSTEACLGMSLCRFNFLVLSFQDENII